MLHKNVGIGDNHPTHNWEYANAAARTGATGFVAGDVHKLALQLDDLSLWILVDTTPTWQTFGGPSAFTSLIDVPASYTGQAGKVVVVNGAENGLEFITGGGGYTDEQAQDAVGTILTDSSTIDFTYNDAGNSITAATKQQMSITSDASGLKLSGDSASPGNNKVYGTDSSGVKGWKNDPVGGGAGRELLTADRTYYVRTDGSDSNSGLVNNSGGAFLTIQKAIDVICTTLDCAGYRATIQVGTGTYTGAITCKRYLGILAVIIQGDTVSPGNVVIHTTSATAITNSSGLAWTVKGVTLRTTTSGSGAFSFGAGSFLYLGNMVFGACVNFHLLAQAKGGIQLTTNYSITGNAQYHIGSLEAGVVYIQGLTITLTGTIAFSIAYAYTSNLASLILDGCTFSGSATGQRYNVSMNSVCYVNGAGASYLPGNSAGATATGGQYV